jgi:hypothetical protein
VIFLNGIEDNVFDPEMARILSKTYPNAKMALFNDTHAMNYNNENYLKIRKIFFDQGINSYELERKYQNRKI